MNKEIKPQISKKINYFFKKMDSRRKSISKSDVKNLKLLIFSILKVKIRYPTSILLLCKYIIKFRIQKG